MDPREFINTFRTAHLSLHRCWTKAVGTKDYRKSDWIELERALFQFGRATAQAIGYEGHLLPHLLR
jgi:hypothetical protein